MRSTLFFTGEDFQYVAIATERETVTISLMAIRIGLLDVLRFVAQKQMSCSLDLEPTGLGAYSVTFKNHVGNTVKTGHIRDAHHYADLEKLITEIVPGWDGKLQLIK